MKMQHPSKQPQGLLEDIFTPITQIWTTFPDHDPGFLHSCGDNTFIEQHFSSFTPVNFSNSSSYEQHVYEDDDKLKSMVSFQEGYHTMLEQEDNRIHGEQLGVVSDNNQNQIPDVLSGGENKSKSKKVEGQPSKNLMAERRRRKRLNDRLSMLRSVVPRISKMDRTSMLGDTINYMKELLEKISTLKGQDMESDSMMSFNMMGNLKELIGNEAQARNQPKFKVERRNTDTHVQICCSTKPGLLLSTVNALEALGLDIQHGAISSFGDFTLQASCFEAPENLLASPEEIKQILIRNAGYGGSSL